MEYNVLLVGLGQQIQQKNERKKLMLHLNTFEKDFYIKAIDLLRNLGMKVT